MSFEHFVTLDALSRQISKYKPMEPKRLFRSRKERILGGVCGGLGNYLNVDPVLIRVVWAILFFAAGAGLLAYILAWIIIPEEVLI